MPDETAEVEPDPFESEGARQDVSFRSIVWWIAAYAAACYIVLICYQIWVNEEMRLHTLHNLTKINQALARTFGMWALELEQSYNEFVNSLH